MAKKINENTWKCFYCSKQYHNIAMALACEKSHSLIYIPVEKDDLFRLIQFIYTKEEKLLRPEFVERLTKYARVKGEKPIDDLSDLSE